MPIYPTYHYFFHVDAHYDTAITEPGTGAGVLAETLQWALQEADDDLPTVRRVDVPADVPEDSAQIVGVVGGWLDADELLALINESVRDTGASSWTVTLRDCDDLTTDPWKLTLHDSWQLTVDPRVLYERR